MKLYLLALALEFFFDWAPDNVPVEQYPFVSSFKSQLEEKGWDVSTWVKNRENTWVFCNLGPKVNGFDFSSMPKEQLVLFTWEPPTTQPELHDPAMHAHFGKIFTWNDDLIDGKKYFKFHYPVLRERMEKIPSFEEKKFCAMIARPLRSKHPKELYSERRAVIKFFEEKGGKEFDLYGPGWKKKYKCWKGPVDDKYAVLKDYKFSICYENAQGLKGYITEKIFDCFACGVVPVYWGADNVTDYIPPECFIDRRKFKSNNELYAFLKKIDKKQYEKYLQAAQAFLQSEKAQAFSAENVIRSFLQIVE